MKNLSKEELSKWKSAVKKITRWVKLNVLKTSTSVADPGYGIFWPDLTPASPTFANLHEDNEYNIIRF